MKRKEQFWFYVCALLVVFSVSGCATISGEKKSTTTTFDSKGNQIVTESTEPMPIWGSNDYETHGKMYGSFEKGKTDQIKAVVDAPLTASNPESKGYEAGMKYMAVQTLAHQQFTQQKPQTFWDAVIKFISVTPELAVIQAVDHIGVAAVDKSGGVVNNTGNGTVTLDHAMDTTKSDATNIGAGSATSSTAKDDHTNKQNPIDNSGQTLAPTEPVVAP